MSEQERADLLGHEIDRLMAGELAPEGNPLLEIASILARPPLEPGAGATALFEKQLQQWFEPSGPAAPPKRPLSPVVILAAILVVIILVIGLLLLLFQNRSVVAPSPAPPLTTSATVNPTASAPTATPLPTLQPASSAGAAPTFALIIVEGPITSVQGSVVVIDGQSIQAQGSIAKLCAGDVVRLEASVDDDGVLQATPGTITVETSACPAPPSQPPHSQHGEGDED